MHFLFFAPWAERCFFFLHLAEGGGGKVTPLPLRLAVGPPVPVLSVPPTGPSAVGVKDSEIGQVASLPKSALIIVGHPLAAAKARLELAITGEKPHGAEQLSRSVSTCGLLVDPTA